MEIQRERVVQGADVPKPAQEPKTTSQGGASDWKPVAVSLEDELEEAGNQEKQDRETRERQREMINSLDLRK